MIPVSIILTSYNRANVIKETIDSILAQTYNNFELIISDDNSTDNTEAVCREYEKMDKRVKYFKNKINLKMPGNLNAAISKTNGSYIANLHDGDIYRNDLIEKWKNALDKYPDCAFVFNEYYYQRTAHLVLMTANIKAETGKYEVIKNYFETLSSSVWGTCMVRSEAYKKYGLFNPEYGFISDVEMWLKLARYEGYVYIHEPLITLTPREPDHIYAYVHWRLIYWLFAIYKKMLELYKDVLPEEVNYYKKNYRRRIRKEFILAMLVLIKHKKWKRIKEGFAIWKDSHDKILKFFGFILGQKRNLPDWYFKEYWSNIDVIKNSLKKD